MNRQFTAVLLPIILLLVFTTLSTAEEAVSQQDIGASTAPMAQTAASEAHGATVSPGATVSSTVDVLNIRAVPDLQGRRVGQLLSGRTATVLENRGEWLKIETGEGVTGYVFRAYTNAATASLESPTPDAGTGTTPAMEAVADAPETVTAAVPDTTVVATNRTLRPLANTYLERVSARGMSTDMSADELEQAVGRGFISALTPEEIAAIDAQGMLSLEDSALKTRDLERIVAQGVTFVVDKSKIGPEELQEIQGQGTVTDIGRAPFSVQVGVYKIRENAISMLEELKKKGYDPYIFQTVGDNNEKIYAVRLGDYQTIQDAYAVTTHFQSKEGRQAIVTYINSLKTVSVEDLQPAAETPMPVVAPIPKASKTYADADLSDLYEEMQRLREEVEKLRLESEAREMLRITEAEAKKEDEEILSAADRQYVMSPQGTLNIDYTFGYTYNSYDMADWTAMILEHSANHNLSNSVGAGYAVRDNLGVNVSVPFVYKYNEIGQADSQSVSDIGDLTLGASWQPFRTGGEVPAFIFSTTANIPIGRSPYEINPREDLSTGSGLYSIALAVSGSKKLDPVMAYGGMAYTHAFEEDGLNQNLSTTKTLTTVTPSGAFGLSMGLAYAMSYKASIHASFNYAYILSTTYGYKDGTSAETGTGAAASLSVGTGWKISSERTISVNLGIGLTNDASDFSFSFRIPFDYEL